jgi:hypothetical protein
LKSKSGKPLNLRIFDIRGFEAERGYEHEFDLLLNGRLPIGFSVSLYDYHVRRNLCKVYSRLILYTAIYKIITIL